MDLWRVSVGRLARTPPTQRRGPWDNPSPPPPQNPSISNPRARQASQAARPALHAPTHPARPSPPYLSSPGRPRTRCRRPASRDPHPGASTGTVILPAAPPVSYRRESESGVRRRRPPQRAREGARVPALSRPATTLLQRPPARGRREGGDSVPAPRGSTNRSARSGARRRPPRLLKTRRAGGGL